ncbi:MAG: Asp-tRNA(Asn)/Glu-tRNA(Gln) amidotransferase subunit GatB, partial [Nitrospinaceae bacterium]|nr:Asp-tRNA(Asn)/Glu-tRNA(Gln) amidotransferase subunit GatB [Nitrospinaceae bacterium]NIR53478.1 Asp-tRNA(Asn)/Glu-tRNA(Gln) amidotransferase subunit GatB [Nitrospinaceae bacterium]NIS85625.1 Asp-tRNA(Asn)/Glu-tRNA(Gln) amidotransferase subunit GatB [Nitrospinaceae bacterium]NIT82470.1 Asp-tRNA(Asn)/Glu-tRNA(Gln) amidotransferase subunit GatB [Nitrospinaceae bacterium]NIU44675.1 Asp-tRNA(Asn)/Glu-tRNA(Gln) amidotransferase subunit GatB [Nitrospinaceae bacterium]
TGVPLIEIVSEPDLRSPEEAREYLTQLKAILEYTEVSDCNMEEGSLRCDANISVRPVGQKELGTRTELKNLNSFKFVQKALEHEVQRQIRVLEQGDAVIQETRLFDPSQGITFSMRGKEEAHDYRYFPEPDLVPVVVDPDWIQGIRQTVPELPEEKRKRFVETFEIPEYDAGVLTASKRLAHFYEECVSLFPKPKMVSNWMMGELLRILKNEDRGIESCPVSSAAFADLLKLVDQGTISTKIGKTVFEEMVHTGKPAEKIVQEKGMTQISDGDA